MFSGKDSGNAHCILIIQFAVGIVILSVVIGLLRIIVRILFGMSSEVFVRILARVLVGIVLRSGERDCDNVMMD